MLTSQHSLLQEHLKVHLQTREFVVNLLGHPVQAPIFMSCIADQNYELNWQDAFRIFQKILLMLLTTYKRIYGMVIPQIFWQLQGIYLARACLVWLLDHHQEQHDASMRKAHGVLVFSIQNAAYENCKIVS